MHSPVLSKSTRLEVYTIIEQCLEVNTEESFKVLLNKTQNLFGHEMAAIGIGDIQKKTVFHTINVGFPPDFMKTIVDHSGQMLSPLFHRWIDTDTPQLLNFKDNPQKLSYKGISPYSDFSIRNVMSYGLVDTDKKYATYFGFAEIPGSLGNQQIHLMKMLAPHLHVAFAKIPNVRNKLPGQSNDELIDSTKNLVRNKLSITPSGDYVQILTQREREVLIRLFEGKSNCGISCNMKISKFTVKNHVQNIIKKLNASSRQHAVAIALQKGLITLV